MPTETVLRQEYYEAVASSVLVHSGVGMNWDICLRVLDGHWGNVEAVAVSPQGTLVATASLDNTVRLWDFVTGASIQRFTIESERGVCSSSIFS